MLNQALGSSSSPSRILRGSAIGSSSSGRDGEQVTDGGRRVAGAHQGLTDQHGVGAGAGGRLDAGPVADAALGDQDRAGGHGPADLGQAARVDRKGGQVAGVPPDQGGAGGGGDLGLGDGVDLDQGVKAGLGGLLQQVAEGVRVKGGDDQQDGVGPPGARLPDLVAGGDEVLARDGQADRQIGR